ncbi:MAG: 8-oxo-dGTP diphosphatase MutT [Candidatus Omnitrophica bacterium]|nr:8-oxo-dGTP diphosphatase MutT [Candidatus Omnitrophota bacterium]
MLSPLDVAVAVIEREGRFLIAQRLPNDSFGGWWEFPGGKLQPRETLEQALVREIEEELGVQISVGAEIQQIEHRYPNRTIRLHCFSCRLLSGEPQAKECAAWRWVGPGELKEFRFLPASGKILEFLEKAATPR